MSAYDIHTKQDRLAQHREKRMREGSTDRMLKEMRREMREAKRSGDIVESGVATPEASRARRVR